MQTPDHEFPDDFDYWLDCPRIDLETGIVHWPRQPDDADNYKKTWIHHYEMRHRWSRDPDGMVAMLRRSLNRDPAWDRVEILPEEFPDQPRTPGQKEVWEHITWLLKREDCVPQRIFEAFLDRKIRKYPENHEKSQQNLAKGIPEILERDWQIPEEDSARILGMTLEEYQTLKEGKHSYRDRNANYRIEKVIGIWRNASGLFQDREAGTRWLRAPQKSFLDGKSPMELITGEDPHGLLEAESFVFHVVHH